ncbi:glycoside hydrolase family 43 protein [Enterococcus mediterraneensis]|uniref:glycoside hydrolase family 43 protein n=1 Tax=Enterococcus mediterraneensis TaxID=2364791 RepID=UPI001F156D1A|nr:glycoside hydrolase family 43 protein [Enterococcus mediterraneensis]
MGCQLSRDVSALPQNEWTTTNQARVSIHDPSVTSIKDDQGNEIFYLFGSHIAQAKTEDFLAWEVPFVNEYENMDDNLLFGKTKENLAETFKWAGYDDADSAGGFNIWAPDVIWNDSYEWSDGSKGAYMLYYSASSTWRRSAIGFAVAKTIEGPYTYDSTIVYSGFTEKDSTDGSERNTNYGNTNLKRLIDDKSINGFSEKWVIEDGLTYNTDYAPNAIDPALFYDEDGRLWMTYGSWSGGIYILELDPKNGQPIYPGEDGLTSDGRTIDRYFGTKLSGGYHQSGEGAYIVYDEDTDYYYLFVTYGGLSAKGGYNMRLFRSESPEGPYLDAKGNSPIIEKGEQNIKYGIKLMGNYQFAHQRTGFRAAGHNSVIIDENGDWYLVFHTRFNNGSEVHEVRVHSMYMNEDGWPVPAPFEYRDNEEIAENMKDSQIAGRYEIINHGTDNGKTMIKSQVIELLENGEIKGDLSGKWSHSKGAITLTIGENIFKGTLLEQQIDATGERTSLTFSTIGNNNESIWGNKQD